MTEALSERRLLEVVRRHLPACQAIRNLRRLSGGASAETWSFDADLGEEPLPCILRRSAVARSSATAITPATEARLQQVVREDGVPVAAVHFVLDEEDRLGEGYVMERIDGETIAPRILRDDRYSVARARMACQCGEILARIHGVGEDRLPPLRRLSGSEQLAQYREIYDRFDEPRPIFDLAFVELEHRLEAASELSLVHGDFRHGNFIVGEQGIRAVLDWELAHLGDPYEDIAWLCVNSWRFGVTEKPVGGFGDYDDLFAGYCEASGAEVDRPRVQTWEIFGSLKWGVMCLIQGFSYLDGRIRSVEKAAIGRRVSETEADLVRLLDR